MDTVHDLISCSGGQPAVRGGPTGGADREILLLVAKGLSNPEIADTLAVSASTVNTHVGNVLAKPGRRDRVQAVVLADETGVVRPGR